MPRVSFLDVINYLEQLVANHVDVKTAYRWNVSEISGALRSGIELPVMLIDAVETQTLGDNTKTLHINSTAFTILGKPNTRTGNLDQYEAQNETLDYCQQICFDLEQRILYDSENVKDANGNKSWLYGLVDKNSFHHFKVGPLFSEGLYGYRCELSLKNQVGMAPDGAKWADL
ncbi:hypothetical protein [Leptobacterium sp. I13]|uniref:hypothetical protein n=1 Tax=Leptobacterium meishanense TaxID=3128904 RepID=UPI0030EEF5F2